MIKGTALALIASMVFAGACGEAPDNTAPKVVSTVPANGSRDVDPALTEISVTFDEEMRDGNWSWAYQVESKFPEMTGQPYYVDGNQENLLPVRLEANKEYEVWINSPVYKNFMDVAGNEAPPYKLSFKTR